jgi:hypothetical protein
MRLFPPLFIRFSVLGLALLTLAACSGPDAIEVSVTPTEEFVQPTALQADATLIPSPTIESIPSTVPPPTSTVVSASVTPENGLPIFAVADVKIGHCRLSGDLAPSGFSGNGTAAAPTPTPAPIDSSRHPDLVAMELGELRLGLEPISQALDGFDGLFLVTWPLTTSAESQAAQLHVLGNRLAQLCSALSQVYIPPEALGEVVGLAESIRTRHRLIEIAIDELMCCGDAHTTTLNIGFSSTSRNISEATSSLSEFLADNAVGSVPDSDSEFASDLWGMRISIGEDSMVVRNSVDALIAFVDTPDVNPSSLGPQAWFDGSAMRIRRLRNRSELSIDQAVMEYEGFINKYGDVSRSDVIDIPEIDEINYEYLELGDKWSGSVTAFIWEGHTYLVEAMCHITESNHCDSIRSSIESIKLER